MWSDVEQGKREKFFREEEGGVWDFRRENGQTTYSRRERSSAFRVIGEPNTAPQRFASQVRPNRYNAGVKMIAGGSGPAPWEGLHNITYLKLPIMGEVAAGQYDVTVAYHEPGFEADADFVVVDQTEVKITPNTFALRVRGQSMIENEISDGDIIIVQAQDWADDGDFVIACLTDSSDQAGFVTLKRFYRNKQADRIVLQPANPSLSPIHILPHKGDKRIDDLDGVKIQGRVSAIIKTGGLL